jgi:hypothetical protein
MVSFAKVPESQRCGVIRCHVVILLGSPGGPDAATPAWTTHLKPPVHHAAGAVSVPLWASTRCGCTTCGRPAFRCARSSVFRRTSSGTSSGTATLR